jgi:putative tryptophan/tyrosine transport system substrate-binding protein
MRWRIIGGDRVSVMASKKFICVALGLLIALIFVSALLLAFNHPANAQERPRTARIGILRVDARDSPAAVEAIRDLKHGLSNLGYVEGQNANFDIRWADNKLDHLPARAAELVRLQSDVIVTGGPQAVRALREATGTIPIVMGRMDDVVEHGLVTSLARPGGNITGLSFQTGELAGKWIDS